MKDFETPDLIELMGGNSGFEFSPVQHVASIPQAIGGIVSSPIVMVGDAVFFDGYSSAGSLNFSLTNETSRPGRLNKISVKGFYPKASTDMIALFNEMISQKYILILSDILGQKMILGNKNEPLSFNFSFSSKSVPGERAGYDFEFSGIVITPSPIYNVVS